MRRLSYAGRRHAATLSMTIRAGTLPMTHRTISSLALMAVLATSPALHAAAPTASFESRFAAARSLALNGERAAAIDAYSALLAESPGNGDVLLGRGRLYAWQERWPEAEQDILAVTRATPKYADAWSALGDVYLWSGRPALAVDAYAQWSTLAPESAEARSAVARARGAVADAASATAATVATAAAQASLAGSLAAETFIPGNFHWTAGLSVDRNDFSGPAGTWTDSVLSLRRKWGIGSLGFEALESRRFGITGHAYALDAYAQLLPRTTLNWRLQRADSAGLFPRNRWRAELFQGLGQGWELSAGYDRLGFATPVELLSVGIGRYAGPFYVRLRYQHVPSTTTGTGSSDSLRVVGRWYYRGDGDHYFELNADAGQSDPPSTNTVTSLLARHRNAIGVSWATQLTERVGGRVSVSRGQGFESQPYDNTSLSAALYTRW